MAISTARSDRVWQLIGLCSFGVTPSAARLWVVRRLMMMKVLCQHFARAAPAACEAVEEMSGSAQPRRFPGAAGGRPKKPRGLGRCRIVVVVEILWRSDPPGSWSAGPLPMTWRRNTPKEVISDAAGRSYYINDHLAEALYARSGVPIRWHQATTVPLSGLPEVVLDCLEVLELPGYFSIAKRAGDPERRGLMALHMSANAATLQRIPEILYEATNFNRSHGVELRKQVDGLLSPWASLAQDTRRSLSLTLLTGAGPLPPPYSDPEYAGISPSSQWLHLLLDQARVPPDGTSLSAEESTDIRVSRDYRARADRFGCAFVGLRSDAHGSPHRQVYDGIEFFIRGLYTDLMLFVAARHVLLRHLSHAATTALETSADPALVRDIKDAVLHMRRLYIRPDFAPQPPYDELLQRLVTRNGSVELQKTLDKDLDDLAQQLQTRVTLQTNALLGLVTLTTLPLSIALSVLQVVGHSTISDLVVAVALSLAVASALVGLTKARYMVGDLRDSRARHLRHSERRGRVLRLPRRRSRKP